MASRAKPQAGLRKLPRGRHGLSKAAVARQQRGRVLDAMIEVVAERGYQETRVVDVITNAGVSRKTFYELYDDKQDCFLAAYDLILRNLLAVTTEAFESSAGEPWGKRARLVVTAFLGVIAEHPAAARFSIVEAMAAGPKALARRDAAMRQFTGFIESGRAESSVDLPAITSMAIVGGVYELLYTEILHGATAQLPSRLPDVVYWVTLPYLGTERASEERGAAREEMARAPGGAGDDSEELEAALTG